MIKNLKHIIKKIILLIAGVAFVSLLLIPEKGFGQTATFNATDTWLCPQGVTSVTVECWGGGGAGGGNTTAADGGGGGGGGAYSKKINIAVTPGLTYTVTVGTGGTGTTGIGGTGNASWFLDATTVLAKD